MRLINGLAGLALAAAAMGTPWGNSNRPTQKAHGRRQTAQVKKRKRKIAAASRRRNRR